MKGISLLIFLMLGAGMGLVNAQELLRLSVYFESGQSNLDAQGRENLERLVQTLNEGRYRDCELELRAFTDDVGGAKVNKKLAEERSNQVRKFLQAKGFQANKEVVENVGQVALENNLSVEEQRRRNRRVDVIISAYMPLNLTDLERYFGLRRLHVERWAFDDNGKRFKTKQGTWVEIPPKAFETLQGRDLRRGDSVILEITEVYRLSDMLVLNLATRTQEGRLLETGGMFRFQAKNQWGEVLKLRADKKIFLSLAQSPAILQDMALFSGQEGQGYLEDRGPVLSWENVLTWRLEQAQKAKEAKLKISKELKQAKRTFKPANFQRALQFFDSLSLGALMELKIGPPPPLIDPPQDLGDPPRKPEMLEALGDKKSFIEQYRRKYPNKDKDKDFLASKKSYELYLDGLYQAKQQEYKAGGWDNPKQLEKVNRQREADYEKAKKAYDKNRAKQKDQIDKHEAYQDAMAAWLKPLILAADAARPSLALEFWDYIYKEALALSNDLVELERSFEENVQRFEAWADLLGYETWKKELKDFKERYPFSKAKTVFEERFKAYEPSVGKRRALSLLDSLMGRYASKQSQGAGFYWAYQNFSRDTANTLHWRSIAKEAQQTLYQDYHKLKFSLEALQEVQGSSSLGLLVKLHEEAKKFVDSFSLDLRLALQREQEVLAFYEGLNQNLLNQISDLGAEYGNLISLTELEIWHSIDRYLPQNEANQQVSKLEILTPTGPNTRFFILFKRHKSLLALKAESQNMYSIHRLPKGEPVVLLGLRVIRGREIQYFEQSFQIGKVTRITNPVFQTGNIKELSEKLDQMF